LARSVLACCWLFCAHHRKGAVIAPAYAGPTPVATRSSAYALVSAHDGPSPPDPRD